MVGLGRRVSLLVRNKLSLRWVVRRDVDNANILTCVPEVKKLQQAYRQSAIAIQTAMKGMSNCSSQSWFSELTAAFLHSPSRYSFVGPYEMTVENPTLIRLTYLWQTFRHFQMVRQSLGNETQCSDSGDTASQTRRSDFTSRTTSFTICKSSHSCHSTDDSSVDRGER